MQLYLTVRPEDTRTASAYPAGLAHAAYRIGEVKAYSPAYQEAALRRYNTKGGCN